MQLPSLEIMIATCGPDGADKAAAMLLPETPGISYSISWQDSGNAPAPVQLLGRRDVALLRLEGRGLSRNRNNLLRHASADLLMVADDDLRLLPDGLQQARRIFAENPELDFGIFQYASDIPKEYPAETCTLARLPKHFFPSSIEMILRREPRAGRLRFNEDFGLGAPRITAGEEDLLLKRARKAGLDCRFFPVTLSYHPGYTTGVQPKLSRGSIISRGVIAAVETPLTAPLRVPLCAWRIARKGQCNFFRALLLCCEGALRGYFSPSLRRYLKGKQPAESGPTKIK